MKFEAGYVGYRVGSVVARAVPRPALRPLAHGIGWMGTRVMEDRRRMVERNLRRIHGQQLGGAELRRKVDEVFDSYTRYWIESFRLPGTSAAELDAGIRTDGWQHLEAGLEKGKGVICAIPHLGGWEWAAFWTAVVQGRPISAVVEPVEPPELAEWFLGLRRDMGVNVIPLGPSSAAECVRALKANHVLCLLCDRDIGSGGIEVDFFGERTRIPGGPATLALRTGATLVPTAIYFEGDHRLGWAGPAMDVERRGSLREDVTRITQDIAVELEAMIRREPEQWHLMQPNWPSDYEFLGLPVPGAKPGS